MNHDGTVNQARLMQQCLIGKSPIELIITSSSISAGNWVTQMVQPYLKDHLRVGDWLLCHYYIDGVLDGASHANPQYGT